MIIYAPYALLRWKKMIWLGKLLACICFMLPVLILGVPIVGYAPSAGALSQKIISLLSLIRKRLRKKSITFFTLVLYSLKIIVIKGYYRRCFDILLIIIQAFQLNIFTLYLVEIVLNVLIMLQIKIKLINFMGKSYI